jgi:hypothetical protein
VRGERERLTDARYVVRAIVQTGPEREALKTGYLAVLLKLSIDVPTNLFAFDVKRGEERLLSSPLIARAKIDKVPPHTLLIDYEVRKPVAWLKDYQNVAIDKEGYLFPVAPFLSPKRLPELYLGLPPFGAGEDESGRRGGLWKTPLTDRHFYLGLKVLAFLEKGCVGNELFIQRVDLSHAFSPHLGRREIVVEMEEELFVSISSHAVPLRCIFPKIVRLSPKNYEEQLSHFFQLRKNILEEYRRQIIASPCSGRFAPRIIDLRIPRLAFIENSPARCPERKSSLPCGE